MKHCLWLYAYNACIKFTDQKYLLHLFAFMYLMPALNLVFLVAMFYPFRHDEAPMAKKLTPTERHELSTQRR